MIKILERVEMNLEPVLKYFRGYCTSCILSCSECIILAMDLEKIYMDYALFDVYKTDL